MIIYCMNLAKHTETHLQNSHGFLWRFCTYEKRKTIKKKKKKKCFLWREINAIILKRFGGKKIYSSVSTVVLRVNHPPMINLHLQLCIFPG